MKNMLLLIICASFALSANSQTTYYLNSSTGNDATGNGSIGNPYRSFYKGYTVAAAGDILNLTGTFTWTDAGEAGDAMYTGYTLGKNLTITGQGQTATIIQAHGTVNSADRRVFAISAGVTITFNDLTIRYGRAQSGYHGAGIDNAGTVTLNRCRLNQNYANMSTGSAGGGLNNSGTATVNSCLVDNNKCGGQGGGIENYYTASNTNILTITNSTIVLNTQMASVATVGGSGICFRSGTGYITNCTIAYNDNINGGTANSSGIATLDAGVRVYLKNNLIAFNKIQGTYATSKSIWESDVYPDYAANITDNGGNIFGKCYNFTMANTSWYDQNGSGVGNNIFTKYSTATTGSLYMNTSLSDCAAPYATSFVGFSNYSSIAVNNGTSGTNGAISVPTSDQRGMTRLGNTDIGAYEYSVYTWTGNSSSDWNTAGNWAENVVPASYADIMIPGSYTNAPVLDQNRTITSINIASGGNLTINGKTLTLHGSITGTGTFTGDINAALNFANTGSAGTIYLDQTTPGTSNYIKNFTISRGAGNSCVLGSSTSIETLILTSGLVDIGNNDLTVTNLSEGATTAYVKTSGTGKLKSTIGNTVQTIFPVGNSAYNPVYITNNSGASDEFSVNVLDEAYMNGASGTIVTNAHIKRTWNISKTNPNGGTGVNFSFNWNAGENTGTMATPNMYHYNGTRWTKETSGTTTAFATALNYTGYTGTFSPFAVLEGAITLPVTWLSFTGKKEGSNISLAWSTASEQNSNFYLVQHSADGINWNAIGNVMAAGNTDQISNYNFLHLDPVKGVNLYRLAQKDLDGRISYSNVLRIITDKSIGLKVYPTVVTDRNLVVIKSNQGEVILYNANGARIWSKNLPEGSTNIILPALNSGYYLMRSAEGSVPLIIK